VPAQRFEFPKEVVDNYQPEINLGDKATAKMGVSFLCNDISSDPYTTFKLSFLSQLLLEGPGSTMFKLLIESGMAPGYCPGYGFDTTIKECVMTIGAQNIENDYKKFNEISKTIFSGLKEVAEKGINKNLIDEVLHLIEFDSKKPRNDFAINMFNQASGFLTHSDSPFSLLYVNEYSKRIRNELTKDKVFEKLVKQFLLDNNHQ
jgi:Zn-dependent M16 (insulinase) family peptidase